LRSQQESFKAFRPRIRCAIQLDKRFFVLAGVYERGRKLEPRHDVFRLCLQILRKLR
jgi:hypothetical protein